MEELMFLAGIGAPFPEEGGTMEIADDDLMLSVVVAHREGGLGVSVFTGFDEEPDVEVVWGDGAPVVCTAFGADQHLDSCGKAIAAVIARLERGGARWMRDGGFSDSGFAAIVNVGVPVFAHQPEVFVHG